MKTVLISRRERKIRSLLDQAAGENLIVRSPDGREFILAEINDFNREVELARQNEKLMAFLEQRARQTSTISLAEVRQRL